MREKYNYSNFMLAEIPEPEPELAGDPVMLTDQTMKERLGKVLALMRQEKLDVLVIYDDLEHGSNFEYLTGFLTRFEEGLLILHQDGRAYLMLGNENTKMVQYSRLPAELIHVPFFSLPNQPMDGELPMESYFRSAGIREDQKVGVIGWKMFTGRFTDNRKLFEIPFYLLDALQKITGKENLENRSDLMICGTCGARTTNNANEIAHYGYGAVLASHCVLEAQNSVHAGITELELGDCLNACGQRNSVVTIAATGDRFANANFYPTEKQVNVGDKISLTVGYKGGLSSRAGYAVERAEQLPETVRDYERVLAIPYFAAVTAWLENIRIGMKGQELYQIIEDVLPKEQFHWKLNPGHLIGDEEWMSSPIYCASKEVLKSGMMLQIDIIPGRDGYGGVSCESGILLADEKLRAELAAEYPSLAECFEKRSKYIRGILNIELPEWVLPMSNTVAYYRPYFMNRKLAVIKKGN